MIKINETYYVSADKRQYKLLKYIGINKDGEKEFYTCSYHPDMKSVLTALIRLTERKTVRDKELTLEEAIKEFERIKEEFEGLLKGNVLEEIGDDEETEEEDEILEEDEEELEENDGADKE